MKKIVPCVFVIVCFFASQASEAAVFNVASIAEFQSALTTAQGNGQSDTIIVAPGTYIVESPLSYFAEEEEDYGLVIQGAGAATTILDGNNTTSILQIDQSYLSEGMNANVTIKDITFRKGNEPSSWGGALSIANYYAQTTVEDCVFQDNMSSLGGGALYLLGSTVSLRRSTFTGNTSSDLSSVGGGFICDPFRRDHHPRKEYLRGQLERRKRRRHLRVKQRVHCSHREHISAERCKRRWGRRIRQRRIRRHPDSFEKRLRKQLGGLIRWCFPFFTNRYNLRFSQYLS